MFWVHTVHAPNLGVPTSRSTLKTELEIDMMVRLVSHTTYPRRSPAADATGGDSVRQQGNRARFYESFSLSAPAATFMVSVLAVSKLRGDGPGRG